MSKKALKMDRRTCLRGLGVTLALPFFEAMLPLSAHAQQTAAKPRVFVNMFPNGMPHIITNGIHNQYAIDKFLTLDPAVKQVSAVVGRTHRFFVDNAASQLTGHDAWLSVLAGTWVPYQNWKKNPDAGYTLMRESFDQRIARHFALQSVSASMTEATPTHSGPALAHLNISWYRHTDGTHRPIPAYLQPRDLFDRLTGSTGGTSPADPNANARKQYLDQKKLILDAVLDDVRTVKNKLGSSDKQRLDEYLTSIEDLDKRTAASAAALAGSGSMPLSCTPSFTRPTKTYNTSVYPPSSASLEYKEKYRLFTDLMIKAMECDLYRVFSMSNGSTGYGINATGLVKTESLETYWHGVSHWRSEGAGNGGGKDPEGERKTYANFVYLQIELFNEFMTKLHNKQDATGRRLLDDTIAVLTPEMGDGEGHLRDDATVFMVGTAGGRIPGQNGRLFANDANVPVANVWLTILKKLGLPETSFGDSTGVLF